MTRFLVGRLLLLAVGLLVASVIVFAALRVLPGDVAQVVAGTQASAAQVSAVRRQLGLDRPLVVQYLSWIGGVLHGDLGRSLVTGGAVAPQIAQKLAVTLPLAGLSLLFALVLGVPLGVVAAVLRRRPAGVVISIVAQAVAAIPVVWAAMLLVAVFAVRLRLLPTQGFPLDGWHEPGRAFAALVLPALTIGAVEGAVVLRFTRSATLGVLGADHLRTAAAVGLTRRAALLRHGLPSVALTVLAVLGVQIAGLLVGAVLVEQVFALPGVGRMLVTDVGRRDLTKVQSELLVLTGLVLVVGFAVDVAHRLLDPRLREAA
ncbi:ABC transporter permease [Curtobacterium sp. MCBD17_013]|uniref:ABC transporter permease n=1 Tax=unclassified Curtobacterium TaxID=257496 RepID=UPI000DA9C7A3|nr:MULTISPECIES: ABC transporter permease [unclassified Curtobacterium]PZE77243.1 ABC transporter permease [Curtobacterium sp. MCBD17_019]PZF65272.1 ABC transporter permease [Curtobacterium sp. MCBD17_013]WIB62376.1 ABC transporter permease [Curtobacterium sp. MCBD17_040]WIB66206.1 ABC transporter permease [Curtobacterium sp. MCBD17_035]WIE53365.1 ABC transporter permease [Curtobacterium sp. MCBD17_003]